MISIIHHRPNLPSVIIFPTAMPICLSEYRSTQQIDRRRSNKTMLKENHVKYIRDKKHCLWETFDFLDKESPHKLDKEPMFVPLPTLFHLQIGGHLSSAENRKREMSNRYFRRSSLPDTIDYHFHEYPRLIDIDNNRMAQRNRSDIRHEDQATEDMSDWQIITSKKWTIWIDCFIG